MATKALHVSHLHKKYGAMLAVDDVSFDVGPGEIVGLLGPNGAGKTSIISMVMGVLAPSAGSILIEGMDVGKETARALACTNFAAVYAPLPGNLTVMQNLHIFGMLYDVKGLSQRIAEVMAQYDIAQFSDKKCGLLSSGEQTRVGLAKAMLNRPSLLLLDEPTASLDPSTAQDIRARIRDFATAGTGGVLWTSHNMYEVEAVCNRVLFLSHGKIILQGDPKTLPQAHGQATLEELFIAIAREPLGAREPI